MKPTLALAIGLLLCAPFALAQSQKPLTQGAGTAGIASPASGKQMTVVVLPDVASACPVAMSAKHGSGAGLVMVRHLPGDKAKETVPDGASQQIHLVLTNPKTQKVASAQVKVYGLSGKGRTENAMLPDGIRPDVTRSLDVTFTPEGDHVVAADLVLQGMTSVRSLELESITYQDGTTWKVAGQQSCSVAPDPMMLVAGR